MLVLIEIKAPILLQLLKGILDYFRVIVETCLHLILKVILVWPLPLGCRWAYSACFCVSNLLTTDAQVSSLLAVFTACICTPPCSWNVPIRLQACGNEHSNLHLCHGMYKGLVPLCRGRVMLNQGLFLGWPHQRYSCQ